MPEGDAFSTANPPAKKAPGSTWKEAVARSTVYDPSTQRPGPGAAAFTGSGTPDPSAVYTDQSLTPEYGEFVDMGQSLFDPTAWASYDDWNFQAGQYAAVGYQALNALQRDLQDSGLRYEDGSWYQVMPGANSEEDETKIRLNSHDPRVRDYYALEDQLSMLKDTKFSKNLFADRGGSGGGGGAAGPSPLDMEGMKVSETQRQLADWERRASTFYGLQDSERSFDIAGLNANMQQAQWQKETGMPLFGERIFMSRPAQGLLSSQFKPALPQGAPPPDYKGLASMIGLPGFVEGTMVGAPPPAQPAPAPPQASDPFAGSPRVTPQSVVSQPPPPPQGRQLMSQIRDMATGKDRDLRAASAASWQLAKQNRFDGIPIAQDITIAGQTIPARLVSLIGRNSIEVPPSPFPLKRADQDW